MNEFCKICGGYIAPGRPWSGAERKNLEWYQEIRAGLYKTTQTRPFPGADTCPQSLVYSKAPQDTAILTGVGYIESDSGPAIAPQHHEDTYRDENPIFRSFTTTRYNLCTFAFHSACWDVLRERLSGVASDTNCLATLLYRILYCNPGNNYDLRLAHDFGGTLKDKKYGVDPWRGRGEMRDGTFSHFAVEPSAFLRVDDLVRCLPSPIVPKSIHEAIVIGWSHVSDIFCKLPTEMVHLLMSWLPCGDIQRLRLASKSIASVSHPDYLPQSFWKSRFLPDFEMGFALPNLTGGYQDWRSLYFAVKHEVQNPDGSGRLRNRKRIWNIINKNVPLLTLDFKDIQLHGLPISWVDFTGPAYGQGSADKRPGRIISTESNTCAGIFYLGSREISVRRLCLDTEREAIRAVGISTTVFNSRMFISGLRFYLQDSVTNAPVCHSLGYITSARETLLQIKIEETLAGLELAAVANGVVGVRLVLVVGHLTNTSQWVGDIRMSESDVAFGILFLPSEFRPLDFAASFDVSGTFDISGIALTLLTRRSR
jgi:hypothetical protein